jgi:uncharacterized membrane protein YdbT with pleckstrin-like domain
MMQPNEILIKPAVIFALVKTIPAFLLALSFLLLGWCLSLALLAPGFLLTGAAWYRFQYIRNIHYIVTPELLRISRGIFFKRTDMVEMYRIKDYVITQALFQQLFGLMTLMLKTTDPENPVIWLRGIPQSAITETIRNYVQQARQRNRILEIN